MSLERMDENVHYMPANVCLIVAELNVTSTTKLLVHIQATGSAQWSRDKFLIVKELRNRDMDFCQLMNQIQEAKLKPKSNQSPRMIGMIWCYGCMKFKFPSEFKNQTGGKKQLCMTAQHDIQVTMREYLKGLISAAQNREKEFDIDLDYVLDLVIVQKGRCYYSNIPLSFRKGSHWQCSLERLENSKGYVRGNVVLICCEFQTGDQSQNKNVKPENVACTVQWSIDLFNEMFILQ